VVHERLNIPCRWESEAGCEVTGLAQLSPSRLLVVDIWNKAVKIVSCDPQNAGVLARVRLPNSPFDVTLTPGDVAAVTIPDTQKIVFFETQSDQLEQFQPPGTRQKEFNLSGRCYGIHFYNGRLFVVVCCELDDNKSCYIAELNLTDGTELKRFSEVHLPPQSRYITTLKDKMYITHPEGVLRLKDTDSRLRRSFRSRFVEEQPVKHVSTLRHVHGIVEVDGDILVCSESNAGVYRILNVGSMFRGAVLAVNQPRAVCFCPDSRRLFVSHPRSIGNNANFLTVGHIFNPK